MLLFVVSINEACDVSIVDIIVVIGITIGTIVVLEMGSQYYLISGLNIDVIEWKLKGWVVVYRNDSLYYLLLLLSSF